MNDESDIKDKDVRSVGNGQEGERQHIKSLFKNLRMAQGLQERKGARLTKFIRDEVLPLNGVPALVAGPTAVAQVKLHFPWDGLIVVVNLEEIPISHCPLLLQRHHK